MTVPISEATLFWAFRHALTKDPFAVNDVSRDLIDQSRRLSSMTKLRITREIDDAIDGGKIASEWDKKAWRRVRQVLGGANG